MASSDTRPGDGGTSHSRGRIIRSVVAAAAAALNLVASTPTRPLLLVFAVVQWILVGAVAATLGHDGSLAIVIPQVVVLLPIVLVLVHGTALRLGGRVFAAWATLVWIVLPYAGLVYATPSLRHDYAHQFLPHVLGLADDPRFPAMVAFLAAMLFTLRALETDAMLDLAIAVGAAGLGAALTPRAAVVAATPVVALVVAGRLRLAAAAAAGLAILLGTVGLAVAAGPLAPPFAHVGFHGPGNALAGLSENFWSGRVLEWFALAGIAGAFRGRRAVGSMIALALLAALLSAPGEHTSLDRNLALLQAFLPVFPALGIAVASIPLLVRHGPARRTATQELRALSSAFADRLK